MDDALDEPILTWLARHPYSHALFVCPTARWAWNRAHAIGTLAKARGMRLARRPARGEWTLETGGGLRAVGVGTALGGYPFHAAFVDAAVDSSCPRTREWWLVEAQCRLAPDAPVWPRAWSMPEWSSA